MKKKKYLPAICLHVIRWFPWLLCSLLSERGSQRSCCAVKHAPDDCCQADLTFLWLVHLFVQGTKMNFAVSAHVFLDSVPLLGPERIWHGLSWSVIRHEVRVFTPEGQFLVAALCFNGSLRLQPDSLGMNDRLVAGICCSALERASHLTQTFVF